MVNQPDSPDDLSPAALRALLDKDPVKALKLARRALRARRAREAAERAIAALESGPIEGPPEAATAEGDKARRARRAARQKEHYWRAREAEIERRIKEGLPADMRRQAANAGTPEHQAMLAKRRALYAMRSGGGAAGPPQESEDFQALELALLHARGAGTEPGETPQPAEKPLALEAESADIDIDVVEPPDPTSLPSWISGEDGGEAAKPERKIENGDET